MLFWNAHIYLDGYALPGLNTVNLEYSAAALDATAFGNASRVTQGGLKTYRMTGRGFYGAGPGQVDQALVAADGAGAGVGFDQAVAFVFPDAVVEGSTSTGAGYMFPCTQANVSFGGKVGELESISFTADGRETQS